MSKKRDKVIRAAVVQLELPPGDVTGNRDIFRSTLLSLHDVDLVVAPELFVSGYDLAMIDERADALAEPVDGPTVSMMREVAGERGITIVAGILERSDAGTLYDTAVVVTPDGAASPYRKSHLFPPERKRFAAGDELFVVPTPAGVLGPQICFEHAFPAISTTLANEGAEIIVIPSAVGDGFDHLLTLRSRARAQDNQVFVVAANLNGNGFCGRSLIADPMGRVLASAGREDAILRADLDLSLIRSQREQEPSLQLARLDLYRIAPQSLDDGPTR